MRPVQTTAPAGLVWATQSVACTLPSTCPAQVVLAGLLVLLPQMRPSLLGYPKLCQAFFSLVGSALEVHADELARLPGGWPSCLPAAFDTLHARSSAGDTAAPVPFSAEHF